MSKVLLCPCEDVTEDDVLASIDKGYRDVESVKRYTGFGTGICQGKSCLSAVARVLFRSGGLKQEAVLPFTPRPPLYPTELSLLATETEGRELALSKGVPAHLVLNPHALRPEGDVPHKAKVVIIGGGIMGLALAHNLAVRGETDVLVLNKSYLCAGASGRNGGGVRMQWGTENLIELAKRSIELMKHFAGEMGINIWLRQGGYLFLAKTAAIANRLEKTAEVASSARGAHADSRSRNGAGSRASAYDARRAIVRLSQG
jgi:sarcosine oxidase subunit beta